MANMTFKASLLPNTNLGYSLGSEDKQWNIYGELNGNAATATKLATARNINDTAFDGTANITTTKWGTARTLTIGSTGKSVNGSANVSWTHAEIGATVSNAWTAGTTAGPTIKTTVNGVDGTAVAIPSASASASGVITTGAQTLAGLKIFKNDNGAIMTSKVGVTRGTVPSANQYSGLYFLDSTGQHAHSGGGRIAIVESYYTTDGTTCLSLATYPNTVGSTATNYIGIYSTQSGTCSYAVKDPAAFRTALGLGARATDNTEYLPLAGGTMTGAITMNKSAEQLVVPYNGTNYDVLHNHNNGNYSLSACGNGLYMGYYNTTLMDWLSGKMSLSKTGNLALNNGLLQVTNYNNTLYIGSQNEGWCHFSSSKKFYFNQNVEIDGQYTQYAPAVISEWWISGRNSAAVRVANYNEYHAGLSMKTTNGSFEIGVYQNDTLWFTYCPDSYYNAGSNAGYSQCAIDSSGHLWGAVWNDYAEMRNVPEANDYTAESPSTKLAGRCVHDVGDGTMTLTTERLQRGGKIVSDTFGFNIGETEDCKTPIAVSGRALVYIYEGREVAAQHIGWPVGTGPDGTVSIMTEEEEEKYPSRIVGTISEIPTYETWGEKNININNRIWIYVK